MSLQQQAVAVARQFELDGEISVSPYGNGHIHDTYLAHSSRRGIATRIILQRINTAIFRNPVALIENIQRVTAHISIRLIDRPDRDRRVLTLISARNGHPWHRDTEGSYWRAYRFIDGAHSCDTVAGAEQAFQAAKAFGEFQKMLADLPTPRLHDTLPGFHNTPQRFAAFEQAVAEDPVNRALAAKPEIEFAMSRRPIARLLLDANLPERVIHNDTKFNNVLFDDQTGEGLCVLDLDTVMPGLAVYDFGDMVRTAATSADEDELDLSLVTVQFPWFEALVRGYLSAAGGFLTANEKHHLAAAGKVISFEQGLRFLTDYLRGDAYYKVHRAHHNLDRCRTQFKLVEAIEGQEERMQQLVQQVLNEQSG